MRQYGALFAFNRGIVSPLGLARVDQKRIALSAETMTNWVSRVLGSMSLRPGLEYIGGMNDNLKARVIPFVFATTDTALVEFTNDVMRVWIDEEILTRVSVSSAITNPGFSGNIVGWADSSDVGGAISWAAGNLLQLLGTGTARAIGSQSVTVAAADQAKEHGLLLSIDRGPVTLKIGTSLGDDSIFSESVLDTGSHSLAFTPGAATFYVQLISSKAYKCFVSECIIESAGAVEIPSPYEEDALGNIRFDQSADVVFLACVGVQQRKIERRGDHPGGRSWSLANFQTDDGPFSASNVGPTTLTAGATTGDTTITASVPTFRSAHVGALFEITSISSGATANISAENTFTTGIKVTGVGTQRDVNVTLTGTWNAYVTLQSSTDNSTWTDVAGQTWGSNVNVTYSDGLDNQTIYYRVGIKAGNYTSGTLTAAINFNNGTQTGVVLITGFTSTTVVSARVVTDLGGTSATAFWAEGAWSDFRGWPTSVRFHEGRLWWAGQNGIFGSVSDNFYSYNENVIGDSGPINRTIGSGPVDTINWILSLQRLLVGAQGAEFSVKSSALDTPLTPTDFSIKPASTQGSGAVDPARIDQRGVFVDRTGIKIFEITFEISSYDYSANDLTSIVPELALPGIIRMGVQRKPDTRIHAVRSDGTVMLGVMDKVEQVLCWLDIESDGASGLIEDVAVLPGEDGDIEDRVYYVVKRTVNGSTVRYLEKWAPETECRGSTVNKQADSFIEFTNSPASATVSVPHLVGEDVVVWQDGVCPENSDGDIKTFTVSAGGTITLDTEATTGVVGLTYTAQWKSAKTASDISAVATTLDQQKRVSHLGIVAKWLHPKGVSFGPDFDHLDDLPEIEQGSEVDGDTVRTSYFEQEIPFPGTWEVDARVCLQAQAPRPATILALVPDVEVHR